MTAMPRRTRLAHWRLWFVLAIVVFNVTFDWQTRVAGHAFVRSQIGGASKGLPLAHHQRRFPADGARRRAACRGVARR